MKRACLPALVLFIVLASRAARAEDLPAILSEGKPLIAEDAKWELHPVADISNVLSYERPAISARPIVQSKTTALLPPKEQWRTHVVSKFTNQVTSGEAMLITGRARVIETTSTAVLRAHFEHNIAPYFKPYSAQFEVPHEWTRFWIPFGVTNDIADGKCALIFNLGYAVQMVELCDMQIYKFPGGFDVNRLPKTEFKRCRP